MAILLGSVCWLLSGVAVSPAPQAFLGQSTLQLISLLLSKLLSSVRLSPRDCSHHLYWRFGCLQILQWHIYRLSFALCTQMAEHNDTMYFTSLILRGWPLFQNFISPCTANTTKIFSDQNRTRDIYPEAPPQDMALGLPENQMLLPGSLCNPCDRLGRDVEKNTNPKTKTCSQAIPM